jgi:hypothetical protein
MKGGSQASTAVASIVSPQAYEQLNQQFDNLVGGSKKKSKQPKKSSSTTDKPTKPKKPSVPKKSSKAPTHTPNKNKNKHSPTMKGGVCMICGGSLMKHMNEYDDSDVQRLYNKKGGANALYNIQYDVSSALVKPAYGEAVPRNLDATTLKHMSYQEPSSWAPFDKYVQYGNVSGSPTMKFAYSGGKATKQGKR